jgi:hypothetical protein
MAMNLARFRRKTKKTVRAGQLKSKKQKWRRGRDLNPRYPLRYVRFRGGSFQPLTHLSGKQSSVVGLQSSATPDGIYSSVFDD